MAVFSFGRAISQLNSGSREIRHTRFTLAGANPIEIVGDLPNDFIKRGRRTATRRASSSFADRVACIMRGIPAAIDIR